MLENRQKELVSLNRFFFNTYIKWNISKFQIILENIRSIDLDAVKKILPLIEFSNSLLNEDSFYFTSFYLDILKEKENYIDQINFIIDQYEKDPLYNQINILYNDWRNLIDDIWDAINKKYEEYLLTLPKVINQENEQQDKLNEQLDIEKLEKMIDNI